MPFGKFIIWINRLQITDRQIIAFASVSTGHQPVQSPVQPQHQHDQEVHRGAHRQAVHREESNIRGRVQLRGID